MSDMPPVNVPAIEAVETPSGGGVTSVTGTAPIASSGGTTPDISLVDDGITNAKVNSSAAIALSKLAAQAAWTLVGNGTDASAVPTALAQSAAARQTGGLLAATVYNPAATTAYTTTSATPADVDATNLSVAFTVPPSGAVFIMATFRMKLSGAATSWVNLREGVADLANTLFGLTEAGALAAEQPRTAMWKITGLTAGDAKTYKLGFAVSGGITLTLEAGQSANSEGGIALTVQAIPS